MITYNDQRKEKRQLKNTKLKIVKSTKNEKNFGGEGGGEIVFFVREKYA